MRSCSDTRFYQARHWSLFAISDAGQGGTKALARDYAAVPDVTQFRLPWPGNEIVDEHTNHQVEYPDDDIHLPVWVSATPRRAAW